MRILLIEDDDAIRDVFKMILEIEAGLPDLIVDPASSGASGLASARQFTPDVILLDLTLPGEDGFEIFRQLQQLENTAHVPVIAVTAHSGDHIKKQVMDAGFTACVTKPVDFDTTLFPLLHRFFSKKDVPHVA